MFLLIAVSGQTYGIRAEHFNTSHVSINRQRIGQMQTNVSYFNTSHVSINQKLLTLNFFGLSISIHLMFLLIPDRK